MGELKHFCRHRRKKKFGSKGGVLTNIHGENFLKQVIRLGTRFDPTKESGLESYKLI